MGVCLCLRGCSGVHVCVCECAFVLCVHVYVRVCICLGDMCVSVFVFMLI